MERWRVEAEARCAVIGCDALTPQRFKPSTINVTDQPLVDSIRDLIRREGPIPFARFMEQALYHPEHGFYSSGRCAIGRRGDYFTSVSVGPLFGRLLAGQFAEIWETLGRPDDFVIVEQGAHHGEFASDVLGALREQNPEFFATVRYRIVEPFAVLRQRQQQGALRSFRERTEWAESLETMELVLRRPLFQRADRRDAGASHRRDGRGARAGASDWSSKPPAVLLLSIVQLPIRACGRAWRRSRRRRTGGYETEINLAALDWIEVLAGKLRRGVVLIADYGLPRPEFYAPSRRTGTLQSYANHRVLPSLLENIGQCDLTTHVEWTSLAEHAEECGLTIGGFTDQHHFLTGLLSSHPDLAAAGAKKNRALQTLIHPEFLGMKFQFLGLTKGFPGDNSLGGFKFARDCACRAGAELKWEGPLCPDGIAVRQLIGTQRPLPHFFTGC